MNQYEFVLFFPPQASLSGVNVELDGTVLDVSDRLGLNAGLVEAIRQRPVRILHLRQTGAPSFETAGNREILRVWG